MRFNIKEQKVKDAFTAIKVITPAISLLKEWGKAERDLSMVKGKIKKLLKEIQTIEAALKIFVNDPVSQVLTDAKKQREEEHEELVKQQNVLEQTCADCMSQIVEYQGYARLFTWINGEIIQVLFEKVVSEEDTNLYATIFLLDHCSQSRQSMIELFNQYFPKKKGISKALSENRVLRYLKSH